MLMRKAFSAVKILSMLIAGVLILGAASIFTACNKTPRTLTAKDIAERYFNNVVEVRSAGQAGTGLVVGHGEGNKLHIISNVHVAGTLADAIRVRFAGESNFIGPSVAGYTAAIEILGYDEDLDIAVFAVDYTPKMPVRNLSADDFVTDGDGITAGERIVGLGNALGGGISVFDGIISRADRIINTKSGFMPAIQTTAALNSGCSGSPVFNEKGQVAGIDYGQIESGGVTVGGISFCIPSCLAYAVYVRAVAENSGKQISKPPVRFDIASAEWFADEPRIEFKPFSLTAKFNSDKLLVSAASDSKNEDLVGCEIIKLGSLDINNRNYTKIALEVLKYSKSGNFDVLTLTVLSDGEEKILRAEDYRL